MNESIFDSELYAKGVELTLYHFERHQRDFVRLAQTIARDLGTEPLALRRYLRSWYNAARFACMDTGIPVDDAWDDVSIENILGLIDDWGQGPYPDDQYSGQLKASGADGATEDDLRRLMGTALTAPTPEAVMGFIDFTSKMKRLGPYNMMMVYTQRPGASAVASRDDWQAVGQTVRGDAIPILILRPKGPITQVFELADTEPPQIRDPRQDPFGAEGAFEEARLNRLVDRLARPTKRELKVEVRLKNFGSDLAGRVHRFGIMSDQQSGDPEAADENGEIEQLHCSTYAISLNLRLTPAEQFTTLLHELGHLFCGHLGAFDADNPSADEYGWPDRCNLPHAAKEVEAELVAWHMSERENLVVGSPLYLKSYMENHPQDVQKVDLDRVVRAIARVRAYLGDPALRG